MEDRTYHRLHPGRPLILPSPRLSDLSLAYVILRPLC